MAGRKICQLSVDLVSVLLVEHQILKAECIQIGIFAARLPCEFFGALQKPLSKALAAQRLRQPQHVDVEPVPVGLAQDTADCGVLRITQQHSNLLIILISGMSRVVGNESGA